MASVVLVAAYRRIWGSDRLAWFKGRQPPGACAALANGTGWTFAVAIHCYADSTVNIVAAITISITIYCCHCIWQFMTTTMHVTAGMPACTLCHGLRQSLVCSHGVQLKLWLTSHCLQLTGIWIVVLYSTDSIIRMVSTMC